MVCARCGADNPENTRFCGQCGNLLLTIGGDDPAASRRAQAQTIVGPTSDPPFDASAFARTGASPVGFTAAAFVPGTAFGSRYRIEGLLGEGGMGAVYKAYDSELDRVVALKIVRPELATSSQTMARFKQELLLASRISQKNILRIHDLGDWNGIKFISMAYVEGTDLAGLIEKTGRLPLELALKYTRQLCAALEAAHSEGVVHRDLKPQNILIDRSENLYVSDFGLAKSLEGAVASMTRTGQVLGTPLYMSPEQVEAGEVDHRSDLYSLGLILYEMFTADLPFRGASALQVMYQRVNVAPQDPRKICPEMPGYIANIIMKCLARDPAERYQSAREILDDIDAQSAPALSPRPGSATISIAIPRPTRRFSLISSAIAALILAVVFSIPVTRYAVLGLLPGAAKTGIPAIQHYLAVMPLSIAGDESELRYIGDGVGDALAAKLSGLRNMYVAAGSTVGAALAQKTGDQIAQSLGVTILVRGTLQSTGDKISITVKMDDVKNKKSLLNREFSGVRQDLLTIEDQIFNGIAETLRIQQTNEEKARTTARPTDNIDAYDLYLKGRNLLASGLKQKNMEEALKLFDAAIAKDPTFALAYAGSADVSIALSKATNDGLLAQQALGAAQQAARLNDNLPEVHFSLGNIYGNTGKTAEAIVELKRAQQLAPNSDDAWRRLGRAYGRAGQPDQAIAAGIQATRVNPYFWYNYNALANTYFLLGQNDKALAAAKKVTDLAPDNPTGWSNIGAAYYRLAQWSACIPAFQKAIELDPQPLFYSQLGVAYFFLGKYSQAAGMFETAVAKDPKSPTLRVNLADAYRWNNQRDRARVTYDEAIGLAYKALEVNPKNAAALAELATAYGKKGDAPNAAKFIRQARQIQHANNDFMYREATIHTLANEFPEAFASLAEALQNGYSLAEAKADPELKPLRDRPEFNRLEKELVSKIAK